MADIVKPVNDRTACLRQSDITVEDFVKAVYFPFYQRKWKRLSAESRVAGITSLERSVRERSHR